MAWDGLGADRLLGKLPAASVDRGIAVEQDRILSVSGYSDPVARARHWGEVTDHHDGLRGVAGEAEEGQDTPIAVIGRQPAEAGGVVVSLMEGRLRLVEAVQFAYVSLKATVGLLVQ